MMCVSINFSSIEEDFVGVYKGKFRKFQNGNFLVLLDVFFISETKRIIETR